MLHCYWIPASQLEESWPGLADLFAKAVETQKEWDLNGILRRIISGEWRLWSAWDDETNKARAIMGAYVGVADSGEKSCCVSFCVGDGMEDWVDMIGNVEQWAKSNGCTRMVFTTRPGWSKVMKTRGYTTTHVVIEKEI